MNKKDFAFYLVFALIIALAFFLRLYHLDLRVFHHDEAAVGYFSYRLFNSNEYSYDPSFHGPFMYYTTAWVFRLFGDSEFSARLLPAILGASMLFLLIPLRKYIGNSGMVISAFFLAFSPSLLYYSRFYREDIFVAFFTLAALVCAIMYAEKHNEKRQSTIRVFYLFLIAILLMSVAGMQVSRSLASLKQSGLIIAVTLLLLSFSILIILFSFKYADKIIHHRYSYLRIFYLFLGAVALASMAALKENAYIAIALIVLFIFLIFIREKWYKGFRSDNNLFITAGETAFFVMVFLVVFSLFYTGSFFDFYGMKAAFVKALSHWYEMHAIQRMGGPMYFYLPILALYELPVLIFGIAGIIHYYRKNNLLFTFLGYWAITNLIVYSYLQEKVPWLVLNPLLPLVIIAAAYTGEIRLKSRACAAAIILLVISSSYFAYSSIFLNFYDFTNPAEPMLQAAQPPQKFSLFLDKINEISSQYQNKSTEIQVTDNEMETQFLWYLRHFTNIKWRVSIESELNAPLIVVHDSDDKHEPDIVKRRLQTDYERLDSARMAWYWFKPSDITLNYILYRTMNRPPDEYRVVLFYKPRY